MEDSKLQNTIDIKLILLGEDCVGVTTLINQYLYQRISSTTGTIGAETFSNILKKKNKEITLNIWDISGKKQFIEVNKLYIKNTQIGLIVYDITNQISFEQLNFWIDYVNDENKDKEIIFGIAANKSDLFEHKFVDTEETKKFTNDNKYLFFETSAKDYKRTENAFLKLVEKYDDIKKEEEKKRIKRRWIISFKNFNQ